MAPDHWQEQLRRGTLELAVLLSIAPDRRYGLEILRHLEFADLVLAEGTIYPLLARLEREGLLEAEWAEGAGPRPRKYYRLTRTGRARLKQMCEEFRAVAGGIEQMIQAVLGERDDSE
jgi:PadR family transcriptional regulator PadR